MMQRPAASWRRLAPLTVAVLAVHVVLLHGPPQQFTTARQQPVQFLTRTIRPPAAPPPAAREAPAPQAGPRAAPAGAKAARAADTPAVAPPAPRAPTEPAAAPPQANALPMVDAGTPLAPQVLALPEPARMHYEVTIQGRGVSASGKAVLDWRHDGQDYDATLELSGAGFRQRVQRSVGRLTDDGLAPRYFSDRSRSEQATHFDRDQGRVVFSTNQPQAALAEGMQDRLSVLVQLSVLIAGDPARFPPGTRIAIPTATTREADTWIFSVEGEEDLELPGGQVRALRLQRPPRREYDQRIELWLAPRMDYAPVRLRLTNPDGGAVDQRWSSTDRG